MANNMITGKAYAFFNYEGTWTDLVEDFKVSREMANFPDTFRLMAIDDKVGTIDVADRGRLPAKIAQHAETADVYGSVLSNCSMETFRKLHSKPVKASDLKYSVLAEAPDVDDSEYAERLGQARANYVTAGWLEETLQLVSDMQRKRKIRDSDVSKIAVFYLDSRGRVKRSP